MKMTLKNIAELIGAVTDSPEIEITDIAKIETAGKSEITFLHNPKYFHLIDSTGAAAVIVPKDFNTEKNIPLLKVENPYQAFLKILIAFHPVIPVAEKGINKLSYINDTAAVGKDPSIGAFVSVGSGSTIGDNAQIQSNVTIGQNVKIGNNVIIYSNVSIRENCVIGNNVIIQNGAVIGSDGFGFAPNQSEYDKIPQVGNVVIEDNVEIGANTCIDRATLGSTIIRKGAKLDNLLQIAHNVEIGSNTVMAAQSGVSGSTKIGQHCMIGGQVGFVGHISIGNGVMIGAQAGIAGNLKDGSIVTGTPSREIAKQRKIDACLGRLPDLIYKVKDIEKAVKALEDNIKEN
ncbi:TPA: UDP-3-O-(3-hydroxymyristoyl)glucosamine N-acyltransferase [Candidatus Delongbacteria bacterium]|nr:MAG: UDP-3-O-(3-hydroxymyristoyl)glucosamine N-acyltransferase [Candidatus Delongbacteria bacterium GWF2_40_14]HAQ61791.1 UDP-3-O-(3-hydroxymyristoyl)glucosamine N-acyltransferase [Candidatus Delongbacteria bacterium]